MAAIITIFLAVECFPPLALALALFVCRVFVNAEQDKHSIYRVLICYWFFSRYVCMFEFACIFFTWIGFDGFPVKDTAFTWKAITLHHAICILCSIYKIFYSIFIVQIYLFIYFSGYAISQHCMANILLWYGYFC